MISLARGKEQSLWKKKKLAGKKELRGKKKESSTRFEILHAKIMAADVRINVRRLFYTIRAVLSREGTSSYQRKKGPECSLSTGPGLTRRCQKKHGRFKAHSKRARILEGDTNNFWKKEGTPPSRSPAHGTKNKKSLFSYGEKGKKRRSPSSLIRKRRRKKES